MVTEIKAVTQTVAANVFDLEGLSPQALMVQMQMLVAKDFDEQMRSVAEKIKFLGEVKKAYRDNLNTIQEFLAKKTEKNKETGKPIIKASPEEMAELMGVFEAFTYNLDDLSGGYTAVPLEIADSGDGHDLDGNVEKDIDAQIDIENGRVSSEDYVQVYKNLIALGDTSGARVYAQDHLGTSGGDRMFYSDKANYGFENGTPRISVFVDGMNAMVEVIKNKLTDVEAEAEQLSASLNQLVAQRKAAIDGVNQAIQQISEVKERALH
jgi:hypothetical protein